MLVGTIVAGGALGIVVDLGEPATMGLLAVLAGGIIFNAIKEELPDGRESSALAFLVGAAVFVGVVAVVY